MFFIDYSKKDGRLKGIRDAKALKSTFKMIVKSITYLLDKNNKMLFNQNVYIYSYSPKQI